MTFTGKKLALLTIGSALALSFVVFGVLFFCYDRGGDPNNEDKIRKLALQAEADDNPPLAAHCWLRLMALNPFEKDYTRHYYHAEEGLMRKAVSAAPVYDMSGNCMTSGMRADSRPVSVRLVELADALRSGFVSQQEYESIRREILASV